jgi:hypothetical protein
MLQEARSRLVDVETGDEPRPMRTFAHEPPARPPGRPGSGAGNGRAVERPSSEPAPAVPEAPTQQPPRSVPSQSPVAETGWSPATFGTDELLTLGEPTGDAGAEPGDGSTKLPPWRRGLRG